MIPLKPIGNRAIIKSVKIEKSPTKLLLIDEKPYYHEIVAIGTEICPVEVGAHVKVDEYQLRPFKVPGELGEEYFLIRYEDILAKKIT